MGVVYLLESLLANRLDNRYQMRSPHNLSEEILDDMNFEIISNRYLRIYML